MTAKVIIKLAQTAADTRPTYKSLTITRTPKTTGGGMMDPALPKLKPPPGYGSVAITRTPKPQVAANDWMTPAKYKEKQPTMVASNTNPSWLKIQ